MAQFFLNSIQYEMGENVFEYTEIESLDSILANNAMPRNPNLFGWGNFFKTKGSVLDLGLKAARKTLEESGVHHGDICAVIFCSSHLAELDAEQTQDTYERIIQDLSIPDAHVVGVTLNHCTTLLTAICMAKGFLLSYPTKHVLLISSDKVADEKNRMSNYCIFSDSAVSLVVTSSLVKGFEIVGDGYGSKILSSSAGDIFSDLELYNKVGEEVLSRCGMTVNQLRMTFANNIFLPVVRIKETSLGLAHEKLYINNIFLKGHCFAADSLINLFDYCNENDCTANDKFALTANSRGLRAYMILENLKI